MMATQARNQILRAQPETGFAMILTALGSLVFVLMVAFAVDVGSWYLSASKLQRASDAAALAGAAALPDIDQAQAAATTALAHNGLADGSNSIAVKMTATSDRLAVSVTDHSVPTYFSSLFMPNLTIGRASVADRADSAPDLGSPFNVLGTGNLDIPGLSQKQDFWLAIDGVCDAKEDGDFFGTITDSSKGPWTGATDGANYVPSPSAYHHCSGNKDGGGTLPNSTVNRDYSHAGYSYFVDIPKATSSQSNQPVSIQAYDPEFSRAKSNIDQDVTLSNDLTPYPSFDFIVWKTDGRPDDPSNDVKVAEHAALTDDPRIIPNAWLTLYDAPYSEFAASGAQYRIQVVAENDNLTSFDINDQVGINSFALGAFPGGTIHACDSRIDLTCPRVYGRNAVSAYNNLSDSSTGQTTFYFASLDTSYIGRAFDVQLWDPGEGVTKLELLGPDGTPLYFDYSNNSPSGPPPGYDNKLDTSGTWLPTAGANLSNDYKYNDRLVTLHVTLPTSYADMVAKANGDTWLRIRYTTNDAPADRTTWGISVAASPSGPPHLSRFTN